MTSIIFSIVLRFLAQYENAIIEGCYANDYCEGVAAHLEIVQVIAAQIDDVMAE